MDLYLHGEDASDTLSGDTVASKPNKSVMLSILHVLWNFKKIYSAKNEFVLYDDYFKYENYINQINKNESFFKDR